MRRLRHIKTSKIIYSVIIFVCLLLSVLIYSVNSSGINNQKHTSFNTDADGAGLLYDTLKAMGYPVSRSYGLLDISVSIYDVYVLIEPNYSYFNVEDINNALDWVFKGGRLIYLESSLFSMADNVMLYRIDNPGYTLGGYKLYSYGLGEIIRGEAKPLLNQSLIEDSAPGNEFAMLLGRWNVSHISFSESIHGFINTGNAWYRMPELLKLLVYQLFIITALVIWRLGKRFGQPVPYYEEIEREENEHIKALANIYQKAGAAEYVAANNRVRFIGLVSRVFHVSESYARDNLEMLWREASLPHPDLPAKLLSEDTFITARQLKHFIKNIRTCETALRLKGEKYAGRLHTVSDATH